MRSDEGKWQRDLLVSHGKIALLLEHQGERAQALPHAEAALAISECLAVLDPSNATWRDDVQVSRALAARLAKPR